MYPLPSSPLLHSPFQNVDLTGEGEGRGVVFAQMRFTAACGVLGTMVQTV